MVRLEKGLFVLYNGLRTYEGEEKMSKKFKIVYSVTIIVLVFIADLIANMFFYHHGLGDFAKGLVKDLIMIGIISFVALKYIEAANKQNKK